MIKLAVIGGGVFSWSFLWQLSHCISHSKLGKNIEITLMDGSTNFSPCSLNSTALVARRAEGFGVSALGDLIQSSWQWWCHQHQLHQWIPTQGVSLSPLYYHQPAHLNRVPYLQQLSAVKAFHHMDTLKVEPAFLINPNLWLWYLQDQAKKNFATLGIMFKHQLESVSSINSFNNEVVINKDLKHFDYLILQPGAYKIQNFEIVEKEEVIYGSFLEFTNYLENYKSSFSFSSHYQLYYHKHESLLQLGIYSSKEVSASDEWSQLQHLYYQAKQDGWPLPPLESASKKVGLRHKLKKRLPIIGRKNNCFYHLGGYKIGYLVSLFQSRQLINLLLKELR